MLRQCAMAIAVLAALIHASVLAGGCGPQTGPAAVEFPDGIDAVLSRWANAQRSGEESGLAAIYDPHYMFSGRTAQDMTTDFLIPGQRHSEILVTSFEVVPLAYEAQDDGHTIDVRISYEAMVAAAEILEFSAVSVDGGAIGTGGHDEGGAHVHGQQALVRHADVDRELLDLVQGSVSATGEAELRFEIAETGGANLITAQRVLYSTVVLGTTVEAPSMGHPTLGSSVVHEGHPTTMAGNVGPLLGESVAVALGDADPVEAIVKEGRFEAQLTPTAPGRFEVAVVAQHGLIEARSAARSVRTLELTVLPHEHADNDGDEEDHGHDHE